VGDKEAQGARAAPSLIEIVGGFLDMKKLIVLSVIFALVAGGVFAVDVSGTVIGNINVLEGSTGKTAEDEDGKPVTPDVSSSANLSRVRLEGSGANDEGTFGVWVRVDGFDTTFTVGELSGKNWEGAPYRAYKAHGYAWWKPIDQFKLLIGGNPDGFFGKEGVTAWMFYQTVSDTGVVLPGNAWGGGYGSYHFRNAFYGGFADEGALLTITPADMATINIVIPFFPGGKTEEVFKKTTAQVDLNLDFGNIALTYKGNLKEGEDQPNLFVSFSGSFDPINIDFGVGYEMAHEVTDEATGKTTTVAQPIHVGLGVKYTATDTVGVKFRAMGSLGGDDKATDILADVLPYFVLGDNLTAFVSLGLAMNMPDEGDSSTAWHFNPYIVVGEEWGAKFVAGIRVWSTFAKDDKDAAGDKLGSTYINWAVPIAFNISF
jgi:hypothetical protein